MYSVYLVAVAFMRHQLCLFVPPCTCICVWLQMLIKLDIFINMWCKSDFFQFLNFLKIKADKNESKHSAALTALLLPSISMQLIFYQQFCLSALFGLLNHMSLIYMIRCLAFVSFVVHSSCVGWIFYAKKNAQASTGLVGVHSGVHCGNKNQDKKNHILAKISDLSSECILLSVYTHGLSTYLLAWGAASRVFLPDSSCHCQVSHVRLILNQRIWDKKSASFRYFTAAIFTLFSFILLQEQQHWCSLYPPHLLSV